jgi:hypothetical protein
MLGAGGETFKIRRKQSRALTNRLRQYSTGTGTGFNYMYFYQCVEVAEAAGVLLLPAGGHQTGGGGGFEPPLRLGQLRQQLRIPRIYSRSLLNKKSV